MPYLGRRSTTGGRCRPSFSVSRPKAGRCCLPVLVVGFHSFGAAQVPVLVGVVVSQCAASAALQKRMAAGHPFMGRGGRLDRGNPEGVPRPQAALQRFGLRRWSSYPRFSAFQLQAIFIGKKKLEAPYRFRGGAISREKGVRFHVDNRPRGGAISRTGGVRFHVEKLAYPQGFSTGWACFGCFAVAFSLVTGRAPGRARLSPKVGGCDFTSCTDDAGTVASSPRCRHQHDAQRCRDGMTKGIEARRGRDLEQGSMRSTKARPRL